MKLFTKFLSRFKNLTFSATYRRVLIARFLDYLLRKLNPNIKYLGIENEGALMFFRTGQTVVTPYALATDGFQKDDLHRALQLAERHNYQMGGLFLDVGAHIGTSAIYAMATEKFKGAYCFEPGLNNLRNLELNIRASHLEDRVLIIPLAVSNMTGNIALSRCEINTGDNRVVHCEATASRLAGATRVACTSLDRFFEDQNTDLSTISFIWVDTQGSEGYVLEGSQSLLERNVPICLEFWPWALRESRCFEQFVHHARKHYKVFYDLRSATIEAHSTDTLEHYAQRFVGNEDHTDLILLN